VIDKQWIEVGRRCRARRLAARLTIKEVADKAGMHEATIASFESGGRGLSTKSQEKILAALEALAPEGADAEAISRISAAIEELRRAIDLLQPPPKST